MNEIKAEIVADSLSPQGDRLTSLLITFPRIILAEVNTHRMLSKNTSSSRAIPFNKMVEAIQENPFIPIAWQKEHKGMQGTEYITDQKVIDFKTGVWLQARNEAIKRAEELNSNLIKCRSIDDCEKIEGTGVTKQLCNRLLEPFMWTTMLITGSKEGWDNFFELRCPQYQMWDKKEIYKSRKEAIKNIIADGNRVEAMKWDYLRWSEFNKGQAEIHMMALAEAVYDSMNESTPKQLHAGEWHIPFEDKIDSYELNEYLDEYDIHESWLELYKVKISTAMAARTSYTIVGDEKGIDYSKMIGLHDRLIAQNPPHSSPMEHCARAMTDEEYFCYHKGIVEGEFDSHTEIGSFFRILEEPKFMKDKRNGWCRNLKGFIQYRHLVENNLNQN